MYRVSEFRTMLTFTNYGPLKRNADLALLSSNPTGIGIRHTENGAPKNFIIVLIICIFFLAFLEPLIHDSKHGNKSEIKQQCDMLSQLEQACKTYSTESSGGLIEFDSN